MTYKMASNEGFNVVLSSGGQVSFPDVDANASAIIATQAYVNSSASSISGQINAVSSSISSNYYTQDETDEAIERVAAYYITYNENGDAFPTASSLVDAITYYSGGQLRVPTRNDYAVVLSDETHDNAEWRYIYAMPDGQATGQWEAQYPIETNDYEALSHKPSVNGVTLAGNKTASDLSIATSQDVANALTAAADANEYAQHAYSSAQNALTVAVDAINQANEATLNAQNALSAAASAITSANSYTDGVVSNYLPLSGGTMTGQIDLRKFSIKMDAHSIVDSTPDKTFYCGGEIMTNGPATPGGLPRYTFICTIPNKSGVFALLQDIASDFSTSSTYTLNALCVHDKKLYRCTAAITTAEEWTAEHWTEATVEDVLEVLRTVIDGKANKASDPTAGNLASLDASGNPTDSGVAKSDVESLFFAQYYPDGSVKEAAEFTPNIKYDSPDTANRTITVKSFCNTGTAANDNSSLVGRVVIPPFVDAHGHPYISDAGTRFRVVGVSSGASNGPNANLTAIIAPSTVTTIGNFAFESCIALTSVSLPGAASIESGAFVGCGLLTSISLPAATIIENGAFNYCTALTSISLPTAMSIGRWVFADCNALASVSLPAATSIGDEAFDSSSSLASVDFGATLSSVPTLGSNAFGSVPTSCKIIVPDALYDTWIAATGWSDLVTAGYKFLKHSEWEYARRYELDVYAPLTSPALSGVPTAPTASNGTSTTQIATTEFVQNEKRYSYASPEVTYSTTTNADDTATVAQLADRASNEVSLSASVTTAAFTLPPLVEGHMRDFFLLLEVQSAYAPAITFTDPAVSGSDIEADGMVMFGEESLANIKLGSNLVMFTEIGAPVESGGVVTATKWLVSVKHKDPATS